MGQCWPGEMRRTAKPTRLFEFRNQMAKPKTVNRPFQPLPARRLSRLCKLQAVNMPMRESDGHRLPITRLEIESVPQQIDAPEELLTGLSLFVVTFRFIPLLNLIKSGIK